MSGPRQDGVTIWTAVGLGAGRGALAGGAFVVLPTVATRTHLGTLAYTLPVASTAGCLIGAACGALILPVVRTAPNSRLAWLLAAAIAPGVWIGICVATALAPAIQMTRTGWFLTFVPAAIGLIAATWTARTVRLRIGGIDAKHN